jgi:hypothetical protein
MAAPNDFAGSSSLMLCWATINDPASPDNGSATVWHTQRPPGPALPQEWVYISKQKRNSEIKGKKNLLGYLYKNRNMLIGPISGIMPESHLTASISNI